MAEADFLPSALFVEYDIRHYIYTCVFLWLQMEQESCHQHHPQLKLKELNSHLVCGICSGYLVDATTIVECLHSCEYIANAHIHTNIHVPPPILGHNAAAWIVRLAVGAMTKLCQPLKVRVNAARAVMHVRLNREIIYEKGHIQTHTRKALKQYTQHTLSHVYRII